MILKVITKYLTCASCGRFPVLLTQTHSTPIPQGCKKVISLHLWPDISGFYLQLSVSCKFCNSVPKGSHWHSSTSAGPIWAENTLDILWPQRSCLWGYAASSASALGCLQLVHLLFQPLDFPSSQDFEMGRWMQLDPIHLAMSKGKKKFIMDSMKFAGRMTIIYEG